MCWLLMVGGWDGKSSWEEESVIGSAVMDGNGCEKNCMIVFVAALSKNGQPKLLTCSSVLTSFKKKHLTSLIPCPLLTYSERGVHTSHSQTKPLWLSWTRTI